LQDVVMVSENKG